MKKFLVTVLAIIYLTVSSGFAMTIHYCMGKISSIDLLNYKEKKCDKCGMKTTDGCCKDDFKVFKINDSHKLITNDINIFSPLTILGNSKSFLYPDFQYAEITRVFNNHSPPVPQGISLCILNSVFRI